MKNIQIADMSLRTTNFLTLSFKEKLEVAKRLNELGVDIIELNCSSNEVADEVLIKTISTIVKKSIISCEVFDCDGIDKAMSLISSATNKRLLVSVPVSPVQMEYLQGKKPAAVMGLIESLTKKAVSCCDDVEVCLQDATRAEKDFLYDVIKMAISNGAKTITIADLAGLMLPDEFYQYILDLYKNVEQLKDVCLAIQCSDEMSMAAACAVSAILCGATCLKICATGCEKTLSAKNVFSIMENFCSKKGFSCGLNKTAVASLVGQISEFVTEQKQSDFSAISTKVDNVEISKNISQSEFNKIIKKIGYALSLDDLKKVYQEFVRVSEKKSVNTKELEVIIANTAMQVPNTYTISSFSVNSSNIMKATASIVLEKDGKEYYGLSYGNGAVDAAFLAIENVTGRHFELDDFALGSVTEGKEAMGQAIVKLRNNGKIYSGRGVSTDIVGAAIRAYINAINKIIYKENE